MKKIINLLALLVVIVSLSASENSQMEAQLTHQPTLATWREVNADIRQHFQALTESDDAVQRLVSLQEIKDSLSTKHQELALLLVKRNQEITCDQDAELFFICGLARRVGYSFDSKNDEESILKQGIRALLDLDQEGESQRERDITRLVLKRSLDDFADNEFAGLFDRNISFQNKEEK